MINSTAVPRFAFLGVCDRFSKIRNVDPRLSALNLMGLRTQVVSHLYPMPVGSLKLVFAVYVTDELPQFKIIAVSEDGRSSFWIQGGLESYQVDEAHVEPTSPLEMTLATDRMWLPLIVPFPESFVIITAPGRFTLFLEENGNKTSVGVLDFLFAPAPPLTEDRIAAIRSDPKAAKSIKMILGCKNCGNRISIYSGIGRSEQLEKEGTIWYREVPDEFVCSCGTTKLNLKLLRENMHALLGERMHSESENLSFTSLYEASTLEAISDKFGRLLNRDPEESDMQTYMEETPLLFHRFAPARILKKPPIFNKYAADFGVLSRSGELYLIEIEKPRKKLLRKDGTRSSDFNHACDQVRDWLHILQEHRVACLEMMDLKNDAATAVQGIVIMGRDSDCMPEQLRKLKSADMGPVKFLTYDDLLTGLEALASRMKEV